MPIHRVKGGWQWGSKGKVFKSKKKAQKQAAAAIYNGYKEGGRSQGDMLKSMYSGKE